jgi:hypothetical protein
VRPSIALATAAVALSILLAASPASAGVTSTVSVDTYKDFDEGEAEAAFITSLGEVKPGWATSRLDLPFDGSWAAVRLASGSVVIGTADDGAIYIARGGSVSKLASIPGIIGVVSLAEGPGGTLFAGTMPGGQVWAIEPATGKTRKVVDLEGAETVWSLAMAGGKLYAGTGPDGVLFEVEPRGRARKVFTADDKRILSLTSTRDGAVWFGTSEKALLYRYDPARKTARAMADFDGNEVTAIAPYRGGVIATANELAEPGTSGIKSKSAIKKAAGAGDGGQKVKEPAVGSRPGADKAASAGSEPPRKGGRKGKGALFYVRGDGVLEQLHALTQTYFTSVAVTDAGEIFAGAADKGRIYLVDADESVSTAFDVDQRVVSQVMWSKGAGVSFTTDDASALYRTTGRARSAAYTSKVFDLAAPSRFGRLIWRGSRAIKLETRSGNTSEAGVGWSTWQSPRGVGPGGGGASGGKVVSPVGRYVQFRARFNGSKDEVLRAARLYYLPANRPTRIRSITIEPKEKRDGLITTASGALKPRSPVFKVSWAVDNPDEDQSAYTIEVRREGEARWRRLVKASDPATKTTYEWNTETFPDGYYRLRVKGSDRSANAATRARMSHHTSELFLIDNNRPAVNGLTVKYPAATARISDSMSPISELSYSIDDGPWKLGDTRDGIFDELTEMVQIDLPRGLEPGLHTLAIRVADEGGNIGSASVSFVIQK